MSDRAAIEELVSEVLDGTQLRLKVDRYTLEENLETGSVDISCEVHDERTGERLVIEGRGVGIVDAVFRGLVGLYSTEFTSLKSLRFSDFSIAANVDTGSQTTKTDMAAEISLRVVNSADREFAFTHISPSITRSSVAVVLECVEFFIDAERAFVALHRALEHARNESRADSVALYTKQLAVLVEATSYSDVLERLRKNILDK